MDEMARAALRRARSRARRRRPRATGEGRSRRRRGGGDDVGMTLIPIIELCRYCPGMVTAMGVSVGLTSAAIMSKGTIAQKERWALPLLTWRRSAPGRSPSPARLRRVRRHEGDRAPRRRGGYVLNGNKTFITNGPYADTIVFICKLDEGDAPKPSARCSASSSTRACPGSTQSKPLRKMGMHSSPTGELFLEDVRVGKDRLIGETEDSPGALGRQGHVLDGAHAASPPWRSASSSSASSCASTTPRRACSSASPIGEFQLIQLKLAQDGGGAHEHPEPRLPPDRDGAAGQDR